MLVPGGNGSSSLPRWGVKPWRRIGAVIYMHEVVVVVVSLCLVMVYKYETHADVIVVLFCVSQK